MVSLLVFKGHSGSWQGLEEMPVVEERTPRGQGATWWTLVAGRPRSLDLDGGIVGLANLELKKGMCVFKCL